ncbi:hypothetical protein LEN26_020576 [Aphanomyces euteiches]|nr:hypothetical protein LEN26_020576 [Aphanomyces euteiches]KAH9113645.1 hypothetical protein AeMF1_012208 [Aphanomyces euteiches]
MSSTSSPVLLVECRKALEATAFEYNQILAASVLDVWRSLTACVERQMMMDKGVVVPVFAKFAFLKGKDATPTFAFTDKFLKSYRVTAKRPLAALTWHCVDMNYSTIAADAGMIKDQAQHTVEAIFKFVGEATQAGTHSYRLPFGAVGTIIIDGKCIGFRYDPAFLHVLASKHRGSDVSSGTNAFSSAPRAVSSQLEALEALAGIKVSSPAMQSLTPPAEPAVVMQDNFFEAPRDGHKRRHGEKRKHKKKASPSSQLIQCASENILTSKTLSIGADPGAVPSILPRFLIPELRVHRAQSVNHLQELILEKSYARLDVTKQQAKLQSETLEAQQQERNKAIEIRHLKNRAIVALQHREMHNHLKQQTIDKQQRQQDDDALQRSVPGCTEDMKILPRAKVRSKEEEKAHKAKLRARLDAELQKKHLRHEQLQQVQRHEGVYFLSCVEKQSQLEREAVARQKQQDKETLIREWARQTK